MELVLRVGSASASLEIRDAYHPDLDAITARIRSHLSAWGAASDDLDLAGLLPRMIRGVAGCESGCPADARDLVERGFGDFSLRYVEGGILMAEAAISHGRNITLMLFPEF